MIGTTLRKLTLAAFVIAATAVTARTAPAAQSLDETRNAGVVVMYHRFGEEKYPSTNIRLEQFEAHIKELTSGKYNVVALNELVDAIRDKRKLPDRTLAITIDDAFTSVYREAWPRLKAAKLPFTVFIATGQVATNPGGNYMTWDQIREMHKAGVGFANHSVSHAHLADEGATRVKKELAESSAAFEKQLGFRPRIHAYPFGEASAAVIAAARGAGFIAAFGQHSGVVHDGANFHYLPRFAINESFGSLQRLKLIASALPVYATDISPAEPFLGPGQANPPAFGFTIPEQVPYRNRIACYSSQHGKLVLQRLGDQRIEVRLPKALRPGRARINCTMPAHSGRWRWFGHQFYTPRP
jgi:peptidoglycan/xylan/chitin deacetylase (PgdA/CDA1 family)